MPVKIGTVPRLVTILPPEVALATPCPQPMISKVFDFTGMYTGIVPQKEIETKLDDGRIVSVSFEAVDDQNAIVTETFETEETNSVDLQRTGWQAILDNFRKYCETK